MSRDGISMQWVASLLRLIALSPRQSRRGRALLLRAAALVDEAAQAQPHDDLPGDLAPMGDQGRRP